MLRKVKIPLLQPNKAMHSFQAFINSQRFKTRETQFNQHQSYCKGANDLQASALIREMKIPKTPSKPIRKRTKT